jgi:hypothetical protein
MIDAFGYAYKIQPTNAGTINIEFVNLQEESKKKFWTMVKNNLLKLLLPLLFIIVSIIWFVIIYMVNN